jgi:homoserine kinase
MTGEKTGRWVEVFAPATVSNVGPGFDCFGFALKGIGDRLRARASETPGVHLSHITGDEGKLSKNTVENVAATAALALWEHYPKALKEFGLELRLEKGIPLSSGLGGSAASAAGGAYAAMKVAEDLAGVPYDEEAVWQAAMVGEALSSGSLHADNIAPCLYGAFTVVQSIDPPLVARFQPALPCHVALVKPDLHISTREAREALPQKVPLHDASRNWANTACLVLALLSKDVPLLKRSFGDYVIEPHRTGQIPHFEQARRAALQVGCYGCSLSGSGPTLFALSPSQRVAREAVQAISKVFLQHKLQARAWVSALSSQGVQLLQPPQSQKLPPPKEHKKQPPTTP